MDHMLQSVSGRVSNLARQVGHIGTPNVAPTTPTKEPCASCGEETAVGSVFFSDRLRIPRPDGPDAFLCGLCDARIRASHKPSRWTPEDVAAFTRNASAAAVTWFSHW